MQQHPLETYLRELRDSHGTGAAVKETSYYGPLAALFNEVGRTLKPRVRCVINIKNQGAGIPDGGFFTLDQFQKGDGAATADPLPGQMPARGVLEVKGTGDDVEQIASSAQVAKYLAHYGQVLVTNYRDFLLVTRGPNGTARRAESYRLATSEQNFWGAVTAQAHDTAAQQGERFVAYLQRVLLHGAPLSAPRDVAWFLASYARDARARIENHDLPALAQVRGALEEALGITFQGPKGDHFFRSTLVQTLFYGIFSAWVLWSKKHPQSAPSAPNNGGTGNGSAGGGERFDWRDAAWELHVPMIRALFEQVSLPSRLGPLKLVEVLDWTGEALNRVDRAAFFERFEADNAVQYFYEPFLEAFDPQLRKDLGVWYTPPEIVKYMVARVDTVLREELNIADGLADERVFVLDPCAGTGAYLVEVLRKIAETLDKKGGDALGGNDLKKAATSRIFGFEILPAPFVVAHLQLGLLLTTLGAPLGEDERAGVYLTNALTGWEPPKEAAKQQLLFPELEQERDAAEQVKREKPILVILGNPPYNGFAGTAMDEERDLSGAYRTTKHAPAPQGQGLNDLYVRFFRMAERRIVEKTGEGLVCFISNYSWLDGLSFTGMRERYAEVFDQIWIDNLHGDRIISEYAPDGRTSETVFAMQGTSVGIKVGTAISLLVAKNRGAAEDGCHILYRDWHQARAAERTAAMLESLSTPDAKNQYTALAPVFGIGLPFKPRKLNDAYLTWSLLPDLFPVSFPGVKTSRDDVVVDIDRERLVERMRQYFDINISDEAMNQIAPGAMEKTGRFDAAAVRSYLRQRGMLRENVIRYCYRPFDNRWLYWEPETKLLDEKRTEYRPHVFEGNVWFTCTTRYRKGDFYLPGITQQIADLNVIEANVQMFPLRLMPTREGKNLFDDGQDDAPAEPRLNLSDARGTICAGWKRPPCPPSLGGSERENRALAWYRRTSRR